MGLTQFDPAQFHGPIRGVNKQKAMKNENNFDFGIEFWPVKQFENSWFLKENVNAAIWRTFHNKFFVWETITNLPHSK